MPLKLKEPRGGTSPFWRVRGTHNGVYIDRTTKTSFREEAQKKLEQFRRDIERGRIQNTVTKKEMEQRGPTFDEAALRYIRDGHDRRFIDKLHRHFGNTPLSEITQQAIEDAAFELLPNATPATRNRQVFTPMSAIMRHAGLDKRLRRPKGANGARREFFFRPEQAEAVINAAMARRPEFGLFLTFLLYTGTRLSEACSVMCDDLELREATAFVHKTKNGLPRRLYLPPPLVAALANHPRGLERRGKLFCYTKAGRIYAYLDEAAQAAGVRIPDGVAFHAFRHTYGSYLRRYGKLDTSGLVATGAWLSADAARRYEHADVSEAARAADYFPALRIGNI